MKQQILNFIRKKRGGVSFVELEDFLGDSCRGDFALTYKYDTFLLWANMSKEFVDAMQELLKEEKIEAIPTSVLVYAIDGKVLHLPIAKRRYPYKEPHWAPVAFNPK